MPTQKLKTVAYMAASWAALFNIPALAATPVFINEIHYDNAGTDSGEAIEIAGPAGTDLSTWSLVLYNGNGGAPYTTTPLSGAIPDTCGGFGVVSVPYPANGIQNGSPDGIALVNGNAVVQFLSYEGSFTAVGGPANGLVGTDIGVSEPDTTPVGFSLQLAGTGTHYEDFRWNPPAANTFGACNAGQTFAGGDAPPTVASTNPGNGATGVAADTDLAIDFSEPVTVSGRWFTINCGISGAKLANVGGGPQRFTLLPESDFAAGETCMVNVIGARVSDQDGTPTPMAADFSFSFSTAATAACGAPATLISSIQGAGNASPLVGSRQTIEAVVVGDFQGTDALNGVYLQEEPADSDGNVQTSEGLFVALNTPDVSAGEIVRVTGEVSEQFGLTRLVNVADVQRCGNATITPTAVTLPFDDTDNNPEWYEGMLVVLPQELTVTENFNLARFGEAVVSSAGRLLNPTQVALPGAAALAVEAQNDRNRLIIDDGRNGGYREPFVYPAPALTASNPLRNGDSVTNATGILDFGFSNFRLQPTEPPAFVPANPRAATPTLPGTGTLRVASFNVLNYFNGDGLGAGFPTSRGAESPSEFERQRAKIIAAILAMNADIVGLIEVENDGYGPNSAIQDLVDGLNASAGAGAYAFINPGVPVIGTDEIAVGFVYQPAKVEPVGAAGILDGAIDPLFNDTKNRPALAQTFREIATNQVFTAAINHFKSKGSPCDDVNDPDAGDGQGNCNITRENAATALVNWLATDPTASGDPDFLIIGDLNAYAQEDPIGAIESAGYTNLVESLLGPQAYSFVFMGEAGYLDHALANASLTEQVTGVTEWHINADEPRAIDYNEDFRDGNNQIPKTPQQLVDLYSPDPYRSADHDPLIVELRLASEGGGGPLRGDLDNDGDVDRNDLLILLRAIGRPASGPTDPRDLNGDGRITFRDARILVNLCTRPFCRVR